MKSNYLHKLILVALATTSSSVMAAGMINHINQLAFSNNGVDLLVNSNNVYGIYVENSIGTISSPRIYTTGSYSSAITVSSDSVVNVSGNINIETDGRESYGIYIVSDINPGNNNSGHPSSVTALNGTMLNIKTHGQEAHGFLVRDYSSLDLRNLTSGSTITTTGQDAEGLNTNDFLQINLNNITFNVASHGFHFFGEGTINVTKNTLNTGGSSIVVENKDAKEVNLVLDNSIAKVNNGNFITSKSTSTGNVVLQNGTNVQGTSVLESLAGQKGKINLVVDNASLWQITDDSEVSNLTHTNNATIDLTNKTAGNFSTLLVNGDYVADLTKSTTNAKIIVNTVWNDTNSSSDLLHIEGTATGYTQVEAKGGLIQGNVTQGNSYKNSVNVITVDNHAAGRNAFYGKADTLGAGQALLVQVDDNNYAWQLPAAAPGTTTPVKPEAPAYALVPKANMELAYNLISKLHERVSEQQTMAWDDCSQCQVEHNDGQVWGRFIGNYTNNQGKDRFGYRSKMWGLQFGYDFNIEFDPENQSRNHTGLMLTYAKDNLKFNDAKNIVFSGGNYVTDDSHTGKGQSDIFALGAYNTYYDQNGSYLDLVANFDYTRNKYNSVRSENTKNHSYGITFSVEAGRPYAISESQWMIEPQAQLVYQYRRFSDFDTLYNIDVEQDNRHGLRGRIGFRLAYNEGTEELKTKTVYFISNVIHDFIDGNKETKFGSDSVKEKLAKTWGEIGFGIQIPTGTTSYIYTDIRYDHSFNNDNGNRKEYRGNVGMKWHF